MSPTLSIILIVIGLVGSSYYSGLETGMVSVNRLRLRHLVRKKEHGARELDALLRNPDKLLGTTLVGNNLSNVILSVTGVGLGMTVGGQPGYWIAFASVTIATLILGEYIPKAWFRSRPASRTLPLMKSFMISAWLFRPFAVLFTWLARLIMPVPQNKVEPNQPFITVEEIRHLTQAGEEAREFSSEERRMIEKVLDLAQTPCREVMRPRKSIVAVNQDLGSEEVLTFARKRNLNYVTVQAKDGEGYVGIIDLFDLLMENDDLEEKIAKDLMGPPLYVKEDTPCDEVLDRMRQNRMPMSLVTNQANDVVGVITSNLLLEQIIGKAFSRVNF